MQRITKADLQRQADRLNKLTGSPLEHFAPYRGSCRMRRLSFNVGHYRIDYAYGGVELERIANEGGGVTTPLNTGHIPKRELYNLLGAFIRGIELGQQAAPPVHIVAAAPHCPNGNPRRVSVKIAGDRVVDTNDHGYSGPPKHYGPEALRVAVSATQYKGLLAMTEGGAA